jgi:hypothetical protein
MKKIKIIYKAFLVLILVSACTDLNDLDFVASFPMPTNVSATYNVTQDNTGEVTITPTAEGANSYKVYFGDSTANPAEVKVGGSVKHTYAEGTYNIKIEALNINGDKAEATQELIVSFKAPENLVTTIENDAAISKQVNITATADFATMFEFYSGETGVNQPVATANIGETINYQYTTAGDYDTKLIVKGAAIATVEYTETFTVTEILQPTSAAPKPPVRSASDVVSIFSKEYANVSLDELPTTWSSSNFNAETVNNDDVWKLTALDFLGIVTNYANGVDLSSMEKMHIDYWVPSGSTNELLVKIVNTVDGGEDIESLGTTVSGSWQSIDIDMTGFDGGNLANKNKITQIIIDSDGVSGLVYIDNFYFYKSSSAPNNVTPIDFETTYSLDAFDGGGTSVVANPDTNGNTSSMVLELVKNAGQPWAGSKITAANGPFSITEGATITAKVWSPRAGLNLLMKFEDATPWPNTVASAEVTAKTTLANGWEELTFDFTGIDTSIDFTNLVLIMDNGVDGDGSSDYTIYLDDISVATFLDFEPLQSLSSFDGGDLSIIANPHTTGNASSMVAKMVKGVGKTWAGSKITVPRAFTFGGTTLKVKVWSPRAGLKLLMKFEDATPWPNTVASAEVTASTMVANGWEELTFDFSGINSSVDFTNLVLIMDNGTDGDGSSNYTIYLDDITQL